MTEDHKIWITQCAAAEQIEGRFGAQQALDLLVGEKFLDFLEVADTNSDFRGEIPAFVAEIKRLFELWQLEQYLETAKKTEPWDPKLLADIGRTDPEEIEDFRRDYIRRCTRELLLVERARKWLLEDGE